MPKSTRIGGSSVAGVTPTVHARQTIADVPIDVIDDGVNVGLVVDGGIASKAAALVALRGDTAAAWIAANPVLANREVVQETDTGVIKIGDGKTRYSSLSTVLFGTYDRIHPEAAALPAAKALARVLTPSTPARLKWVSLGDSVAYLKMRWMFPLLHRAFGGYATSSPSVAIETGQSGTGWSISGTTNNSTTGTITSATSDFDAWFSGRAEQYATGASRAYGQGGASATWDTAKVYYAKGPGSLDNGTFKIQVDGVDDATYSNVSCVAGTQDIGIATITKGSVAQRALSVVNLTGTHRIIGVSFENSAVGGMMHAGISQGGITLTSAIGQAGGRTSLATFITDFVPDVITLEMKESSTTWAADLAVLLPILRSAAPTATIIGIGSTPIASNDADQVIQNNQLKAACVALGCTYWDGYTPVVNYPTLNALGWAGDGTHPDDKCNAFLAGLLLQDMGILLHPAVQAVRDPNAVNGYFSGNVGIGTNSPTQRLDVAAGTASEHARASIRNIGTTGQDATLDLISGFAGTYGNAAIVATTAELRLKASSVGGASSMTTVYTGGSERVRVNDTGRVGVGVTSPTAFLHLKAGTATASTGPLKFNSGTLLTTPEAGSVEFNTDTLYVTRTTGPARARVLTAVAEGTAVLVGGTVTVNDAAITANSVIMLSYKTSGGTPGAVFVSARSAGASFTITSTSVIDTSTIQYDILAY